jgi:hypothetical protein
VCLHGEWSMCNHHLVDSRKVAQDSFGEIDKQVTGRTQ